LKTLHQHPETSNRSNEMITKIKLGVRKVETNNLSYTYLYKTTSSIDTMGPDEPVPDSCLQDR
jgi:hypothetical protein